MTEQSRPQRKEFTADELVKLPHLIDPVEASPFDVMAVLDELREVRVEDLLADDATQAHLDKLLEAYSYSRSSREITNNVPVLIIKSHGTNHAGRSGYTEGTEPKRFRLKDDEHIYFFSRYQQESEPTHSARERLLFAPNMTDLHPLIPVHNVLSRVPLHGGFVQTYNNEMAEWEDNKQHAYFGIGKGNTREESLSRAGVKSMYERSRKK